MKVEGYNELVKRLNRELRMGFEDIDVCDD